MPLKPYQYHISNKDNNRDHSIFTFSFVMYVGILGSCLSLLLVLMTTIINSSDVSALAYSEYLSYIGNSKSINNNITNVNNDTTATFSSVSAIASTRIKPDRITVSFGVETTNKTADSALMTNSELMKRLLNALKAAGVQENETSTSSFTIRPNYNYSGSRTIANITGYTVTNSIQIDTSNIDKISRWIDIAVATGANRVNSIYFSLSDKKLDETKNNLLKDAINNAKAKAEIAASVLGLKVIGVRSINLDVSPYTTNDPLLVQPQVGSSAPSSASETGITPIITAGEQEVSQRVSIVFLLGR